jgi:LacI family gluconate utilization system Gnt-I transcriptional repressor
LRDVSDASGVSEMTVSRVLRNRGDVSGATRERVLAAARELGYVPNRIAGALASQRVNLVAVIIPSLSNMVFPEVLTGVSEVLEDTGLQPVVGVTNYSPEREEKVLYEMLSWRPSGIIIAGLERSHAARAMLENAGIPIVEIMDVDGTPVDNAVGISHRRAGRHMAEAIVAAGYRRIGFLGTMMPYDHRARKRLEGFESALIAAGLTVEDREFYSGGSALLKGREMTETILSRSPDLDFLYYSNDLIGAGGPPVVPQPRDRGAREGGACGVQRRGAGAGAALSPRHDGRLQARDRAQGGRDRRRQARGRGHVGAGDRVGAEARTGRHDPPALRRLRRRS